MKKFGIFLLMTVVCGHIYALKYNGQTLSENENFTRTELMNTPESVQEISGLACSRTTKGYFWVETDGDENKIYALDSQGSIKLTVTMSGLTARDWEDLCIATINGKNYLMIGAFGDNDLEYKDKYCIYVFEEPVIDSSSTATVTSSLVQTITFGYPDGKAHNAETLMYDPVNQEIYIVDKWLTEEGEETARMVFSLPYQTSYSGKQTLTKVCDLGKEGEKFTLATGGDISSDGKRVLIKNKKYVLLWERQGTENLSVTLARQPEVVEAYEKEEQGEAIAWNNDGSAFYTTSDAKESTPFYEYLDETAPESTTENTEIDVNIPKIYVRHKMLVSEGEAQNISLYNLFGQCLICNKTTPLSVSHLNGIYLLQIGTYRKKILIQ